MDEAQRALGESLLKTVHARASGRNVWHRDVVAHDEEKHGERQSTWSSDFITLAAVIGWRFEKRGTLAVRLGKSECDKMRDVAHVPEVAFDATTREYTPLLDHYGGVKLTCETSELERCGSSVKANAEANRIDDYAPMDDDTVRHLLEKLGLVAMGLQGNRF